MNDLSIPFNRPWVAGPELEYIADVVRHGHLSGDGAFTRRCQELLKDFGHEFSLLTTSCTDALEMSSMLLDLEPGDEILVPSFTFVSSANAFVIHGARPIFVDVKPDTMNIDPSLMEASITPRTRAIVVVHYAGVGCDMDEILLIAARRGLVVVEDNAHGLGGTYHGRPLGTFGVVSTLSFHETKNFASGEGGALVINDVSLRERAEIIREKGTDRSRFFRGQVDKYGWLDVGSSFLPAEIVSAYLCAQLEAREIIQSRREHIWTRYAAEVKDWARRIGAILPYVPDDREQAFHMFYMLMPNLESRTQLIDRLRAQGILAVFHYLPLHLSVMGRKLGGEDGQCPVTEDVSDRLVRLPFFTGMTDEEQDRVVAAVVAT